MPRGSRLPRVFHYVQASYHIIRLHILLFTTHTKSEDLRLSDRFRGCSFIAVSVLSDYEYKGTKPHIYLKNEEFGRGPVR